MATRILAGWSGVVPVSAATARALTRIQPAARPSSPAQHLLSAALVQMRTVIWLGAGHGLAMQMLEYAADRISEFEVMRAILRTLLNSVPGTRYPRVGIVPMGMERSSDLFGSV